MPIFALLVHAWFETAIAEFVSAWPPLAMTAPDQAAYSASSFGSDRTRTNSTLPTSTNGSFHEIVLPHLDAAYNLARFLTRNEDAAGDIVQDAFLRAFRAFDGFRGGDSRAWLLTIVRNCVRNWAIEQSRARAHCEPLGSTPRSEDAPHAEHEGSELWDPDQDTPETTVSRDSEARLIRRLIEALPEAFREVLILREFDDLSYKQIAEITATPIGTVMSRLARARQMLGEAWRGRSGESRP